MVHSWSPHDDEQPWGADPTIVVANHARSNNQALEALTTSELNSLDTMRSQDGSAGVPVGQGRSTSSLRWTAAASDPRSPGSELSTRSLRRRAPSTTTPSTTSLRAALASSSPTRRA